MTKKLFKGKRGSIALILIFGVMIAVVMLGMLRVSVTLNASNQATGKQYATIQTLRSVGEVSSYSYISDLMSCVATRDMATVMPGTPDAIIYMEGLEALQKELAVKNAAGDVVDKTIWRVQNAEVAISGSDLPSSEMMAMLLAPVSGRAHHYQLRLEEDLDLNFTSSSTFIGANEARVILRPVKIEVTVRAKSETVISHLVVEGLYMYATKSESVDASGAVSTRVTMRITDDGEGSGVHIYRE